MGFGEQGSDLAGIWKESRHERRAEEVEEKYLEG